MGAKRVLITGGSGFLGTHLALALRATHEVFLADRNESKNRSAQEMTSCPTLSMELTDIDSVRKAFLAARPELVIHAGALKFVDAAEKDALACVDVNVRGSQHVARVAMECGCDLVVGISSNRAAPPTVDVYSLSKAIMERLFCSLNGKARTRFTSVRLGNIPWSTGSVLTEWQRMLEASSVIEVSGPLSRRFFLGADEAVELVLTSIKCVEEFQGRVLARRLKQARVGDILDKFIELKGGTWERGEPRPGEKLEETLIGELELPYCREVFLDDVPHYSLGFNEKMERPLSDIVSTANAEALSNQEIERLIQRPPELSGGKGP